MRLFTNFGFMLLLAPSAVLGTLPAAAAEAQAPIPAALQSCAGLFDPVGVPSGEDGADDASYAFANRTFQPQAATPLFIYKCYGGFAVRMNSATRVPDWSAENITLETSQGSATRSNQFKNETDPEGWPAIRPLLQPRYLEESRGGGQTAGQDARTADCLHRPDLRWQDQIDRGSHRQCDCSHRRPG